MINYLQKQVQLLNHGVFAAGSKLTHPFIELFESSEIDAALDERVVRFGLLLVDETATILVHVVVCLLQFRILDFLKIVSVDGLALRANKAFWVL